MFDVYPTNAETTKNAAQFYSMNIEHYAFTKTWDREDQALDSSHYLSKVR